MHVIFVTNVSSVHTTLLITSEFTQVRKFTSVTSVATHVSRKFILWTTRSDILININFSVTCVARASIQIQSFRDTRTFTLVIVLINVISVARHIHLRQIWWGISEPTTQTQGRTPNAISVIPATSHSHTNALCCFIWEATLERATFFVIYVVRLLPVMKRSKLTVGFTQVRNRMCAHCVVKHSVRLVISKCTIAHTLVSDPIAVTNVTKHSHSAQRLLFISDTTQDRDHISARSVIRVLCPKLYLNPIKLPTMCQILTVHSKSSLHFYNSYFKTKMISRCVKYIQ